MGLIDMLMAGLMAFSPIADANTDRIGQQTAKPPYEVKLFYSNGSNKQAYGMPPKQSKMIVYIDGKKHTFRDGYQGPFDGFTDSLLTMVKNRASLLDVTNGVATDAYGDMYRDFVITYIKWQAEQCKKALNEKDVKINDISNDKGKGFLIVYDGKRFQILDTDRDGECDFFEASEYFSRTGKWKTKLGIVGYEPCGTSRYYENLVIETRKIQNARSAQTLKQRQKEFGKRESGKLSLVSPKVSRRTLFSVHS